MHTSDAVEKSALDPKALHFILGCGVCDYVTGLHGRCKSAQAQAPSVLQVVIISRSEAAPEAAQEEGDLIPDNQDKTEAAPSCAAELAKPPTESLSADQEEAQRPPASFAPRCSEVCCIAHAFSAICSQLRSQHACSAPENVQLHAVR